MLTANPSKCKLACWTETYLAYAVKGKCLRLLVGKVQALQDCPIPTTEKRVWHFVGLARYYRRFIPNFAMITAPLTGLGKDAANDLSWGVR